MDALAVLMQLLRFSLWRLNRLVCQSGTQDCIHVHTLFPTEGNLALHKLHMAVNNVGEKKCGRKNRSAKLDLDATRFEQLV